MYNKIENYKITIINNFLHGCRFVSRNVHVRRYRTYLKEYLNDIDFLYLYIHYSAVVDKAQAFQAEVRLVYIIVIAIQTLVYSENKL